MRISPRDGPMIEIAVPVQCQTKLLNPDDFARGGVQICRACAANQTILLRKYRLLFGRR